MFEFRNGVLHANSANFLNYSKKVKQSICGENTQKNCQIFAIWPKEVHVRNPGSDTLFSNEVENKIQIRTDMLLQRSLE